MSIKPKVILDGQQTLSFTAPTVKTSLADGAALANADAGLTAALTTRNQHNAKHSTGPRTRQGKQVAAQNALQHGLTANPAAGTPEDSEAFTALLAAVAARLVPADVIEDALIHRIALAIWRQQRAVRAEAALACVGVSAVTGDPHEVHFWIEQITRAWEPVMHERPQDNVHGTGKSRKLPPTVTWQRTRLAKLDALRDEKIRLSGAAITAMMVMIEALADRLAQVPASFNTDHAEQLAWLLGDYVGYFPIIDNGRFQTRTNHTPVQKLIAAAMDRLAGEMFSDQLATKLQTRVDTLDYQRRYCETPHTTKHARAVVTGTLLPAGDTLDRLLRYETHADRTLIRALDTLARLRGVTVESLSTTVTTHHQGPTGSQEATGTMLQVAASKMAMMPSQPARPMQ